MGTKTCIHIGIDDCGLSLGASTHWILCAAFWPVGIGVSAVQPNWVDLSFAERRAQCPLTSFVVPEG